ncbi:MULTISPECIES: P-II family nitrogen regulator [unclassified Sinorhizobium]|uniref:P-II family nitrogen regulator n=1 Tax=unclassified Sinorhizobium TaxID=2613772 RepID=UPI0035261068
MKKIEAIIKPFKLAEVREALEKLGHDSFTVTEAKGFGGERGRVGYCHGAEYGFEFFPLLKLELIAPDEGATAAIEAICQTAQTGRSGDGKIFVSCVEEIIPIATKDLAVGVAR